MKVKTVNLYQFEELSEEQQKRCIEKHRDINDDITCDLINFDDIHRLKLVEQGFLNPKISYSLSYCQGDGASFTCTQLDYDLLLKDYAGKHKSWMVEILEQYCEVKIERSYYCRYVHGRSCNTELYEYMRYNYPRIIDELENIRHYIEKLRLTACEILEHDLQAQIDYLTSDEGIKEVLVTNEYYFNEETLAIEC